MNTQLCVSNNWHVGIDNCPIKLALHSNNTLLLCSRKSALWSLQAVVSAVLHGSSMVFQEMKQRFKMQHLNRIQTLLKWRFNVWAHFQGIELIPAWLSVTEPAGWVRTEPFSIRIHPSYLDTLPQRAASRASTITAFHPQQLTLNLSLSQSLSVPFPVWPQVSTVVFLAFFFIVSLLSFFSPCHHPACCPPHWGPGPGSGPCHVPDRNIKPPDWLAGRKMPPY